MKKQTNITAGGEADTEIKGDEPIAQAPDETASAGLMTENAELRSALRLSAARDQLSTALFAAGARTPALLCDAVNADLQIADDGGVANAAALVERLKTRFPEQFRRASPISIDGGAGRSTPAPLTKDALAKMSPAEITKLDWAAVRRVLSEK
ncbi:MAG: hypothetical protein ABJA02_06365 [Acidobacteriota bacterium]